MARETTHLPLYGKCHSKFLFLGTLPLTKHVITHSELVQSLLLVENQDLTQEERIDFQILSIVNRTIFYFSELAR